ncbi:MAG: N-acetylmuramoyl-L-alanine amidase [Clostridiales Family XIII bacterium]|jgi:N-acetylmuramoyl-L-alanine amidase|nr:N-acetylmuramoyl-L-alanine amidase [Clostridiales Family XIII bacterium]
MDISRKNRRVNIMGTFKKPLTYFISALAIIIFVSLSYAPPSYAAAGVGGESLVYLKIDGVQIGTDVPPVIINDRTLVPARAVFETLGGTVLWNDSVKPAQVSITYADTSVLLTIDSATAFVNGRATYLDVPAQILDGRTLIPVRFVSESLNFSVNWDAAARTVNIYSSRDKVAAEDYLINGIRIDASENGSKVTITGAGIMNNYTSLADWDRFTVDLIGGVMNTTTASLEWHREISVVRNISASQISVRRAANGAQPTDSAVNGNGAQPAGSASNVNNSTQSAVSANGSASNGSETPSVTRLVFNTSESVNPVISFSADQTVMYIDFPKPTLVFNPLIDGKLSVVLDPGHGAETAGKKSPDNSLMEYEFNRDMAKRIKSHLERHGVEVLITTPDDKDLPLADRCKFANESDADIFVSIHANAFGNGDDWTSTKGWEIYIYKKGSYSEQLAKAIHSAAIPASGLADRGIKTGMYYVIANANMPAVLVEHGFYTNQDEIQLLKSNDFRERLAVMDAKGILNFFGVSWID